MFKKAFEKKSDISNFKKLYSNGEIDSIPVVNLSYEASEIHNEDFSKFVQFKTDNPVIFIIDSFRLEYLFHIYGKCDFKFSGNREYKNYLLTFNDNIYIVSSTTEVVSNNLKNRTTFISDVALFEMALSSEVLKFKIEQLTKSKENQKLLDYLLKIETDSDGNIIW